MPGKKQELFLAKFLWTGINMESERNRAQNIRNHRVTNITDSTGDYYLTREPAQKLNSRSTATQIYITSSSTSFTLLHDKEKILLRLQYQSRQTDIPR